MSSAMRRGAKTASGAVAPAPRNICIRPLAFFVIICSCHVRRLRRGGRDQDKGALQAPTSAKFVLATLARPKIRRRPRRKGGPTTASTRCKLRRVGAENVICSSTFAALLQPRGREVARCRRARKSPESAPNTAPFDIATSLSRLSSMLHRQRHLCQDSWCA